MKGSFHKTTRHTIICDAVHSTMYNNL